MLGWLVWLVWLFGKILRILWTGLGLACYMRPRHCRRRFEVKLLGAGAGVNWRTGLGWGGLSLAWGWLACTGRVRLCQAELLKSVWGWRASFVSDFGLVS